MPLAPSRDWLAALTRLTRVFRKVGDIIQSVKILSGAENLVNSNARAKPQPPAPVAEAAEPSAAVEQTAS